MGAFLRLTRPLNLLIIIFTMVAIRYGVIGAYLDASTVDLQAMASPDATLIPEVPMNTFTHAFSELHFWLLVVSTVLIAAGGNVINDYFDTRIDRVNKPDHVIVGRSVKRRVAMLGHLVLTALGIVIGVFVAWRSGQYHLVVLPLFAAGALWWYSTRLKRSFLLGNGLVALLVAIVPLSVGLYEIPALAHAYGGAAMVQGPDGKMLEAAFGFDGLWAWVLGYAFFAFLTTLVRELQKDMADIKGDEADGCRTVPIVWGVKWAKVIALFYLACTILALLGMRMIAFNDNLSHWYIGVGIIGPLLLSAGFTFNATTRKEFNTAGNILKAGMAIAIAFAFLVRHTL